MLIFGGCDFCGAWPRDRSGIAAAGGVSTPGSTLGFSGSGDAGAGGQKCAPRVGEAPAHGAGAGGEKFGERRVGGVALAGREVGKLVGVRWAPASSQGAFQHGPGTGWGWWAMPDAGYFDQRPEGELVARGQKPGREGDRFATENRDDG